MKQFLLILAFSFMAAGAQAAVVTVYGNSPADAEARGLALIDKINNTDERVRQLHDRRCNLNNTDREERRRLRRRVYQIMGGFTSLRWSATAQDYVPSYSYKFKVSCR